MHYYKHDKHMLTIHFAVQHSNSVDVHVQISQYNPIKVIQPVKCTDL